MKMNAGAMNPMSNSRTAKSLSKGQATHGSDRSKGGAGKVMGPPIAPGWIVSGKGNPRPTGGKFAGANKAKQTRSSSKRGKFKK